MKNNYFIISLIYILLFSSCGFKVVNKTNLLEYSIAEISTSGDKKVNFKLKNLIQASSKNNKEKLINIEIKSERKKTVKEKNIKNEITKYEIKINVTIKYKDLGNNKTGQFSVSNEGDYSVADQYSQTLNNEKKLTELLTNNLSDEILSELIRSINAI